MHGVDKQHHALLRSIADGANSAEVKRHLEAVDSRTAGSTLALMQLFTFVRKNRRSDTVVDIVGLLMRHGASVDTVGIIFALKSIVKSTVFEPLLLKILEHSPGFAFADVVELLRDVPSNSSVFNFLVNTFGSKLIKVNDIINRMKSEAPERRFQYELVHRNSVRELRQWVQKDSRIS